MATLEKLTFSTNWNKKLDCDVFTTLRLNSDKYKVGNVYEVFYKRPVKNIKIIEKKVIKLHEINEWVALIDTGYSREECINIIKRMYSKYDINWDTQQMQLLLCKTVK